MPKQEKLPNNLICKTMKKYRILKKESTTDSKRFVWYELEIAFRFLWIFPKWIPAYMDDTGSNPFGCGVMFKTPEDAENFLYGKVIVNTEGIFPYGVLLANPEIVKTFYW